MTDSRAPLRDDVLARRLGAAPGPRGGAWHVRTVASTGSTNADLAEDARRGTPEGAVLVAELQSAGRGRLGRTWTSPAGASLTFSVLLRPPVPPALWAWLPLLTGVASAEGVTEASGVGARLKWPNDLLVPVPAGDGKGEEGKVAGVLAERVDDATVVGVGLNVSQAAEELPVPTATSLRLARGRDEEVDREGLLVAVLGALGRWYDRWCDAAGDPDASGVRHAYSSACLTLGRPVEVTVPDGGTLSGVAVDVDAEGRLVVRTDVGERALAAGDVRHVR